MTSLVYRGTQGHDLTYGQVDGNFAELDRRTAQAWQNLRGQVDLSGVGNPPTMSAYNGVPIMAFSHGIVQVAPVTLHMPHDYVAGSDIYPHGHIFVASANTGVIRWGFTMLWANEYDAADWASPPRADQKFQSLGTTYVEYTVRATDQDAQIVVSTPTPISLPLLQPDAVLLMSVFRDGTHVNDTYPDQVFLTYVDLYYQSQGFGSTDM